MAPLLPAAFSAMALAFSNTPKAYMSSTREKGLLSSRASSVPMTTTTSLSMGEFKEEEFKEDEFKAINEKIEALEAKVGPQVEDLHKTFYKGLSPLEFFNDFARDLDEARNSSSLLFRNTLQLVTYTSDFFDHSHELIPVSQARAMEKLVCRVFLLIHEKLQSHDNPSIVVPALWLPLAMKAPTDEDLDILTQVGLEAYVAELRQKSVGEFSIFKPALTFWLSIVESKQILVLVEAWGNMNESSRAALKRELIIGLVVENYLMDDQVKHVVSRERLTLVVRKITRFVWLRKTGNVLAWMAELTQLKHLRWSRDVAYVEQMFNLKTQNSDKPENNDLE